MANKDYGYVSIRIKKETFELLCETKDSFEDFCDKKLTVDEFQQTLIEALSKTEPEFWEIFTMKKEMQRQLQEKMNAAKLRKKMNNQTSDEQVEQVSTEE